MLRLERRVFRAIAVVVLGCAVYGMHVVPARAEGETAVEPETVESRANSVRIDRPFDKVYEFLVNPANWNQWALGLGKNIRPSKDGWIADSDGRIASVRFTPRNSFGVVDHTIIRPSGQRVYVPMRLIVNGSGKMNGQLSYLRACICLLLGCSLGVRSGVGVRPGGQIHDVAPTSRLVVLDRRGRFGFSEQTDKTMKIIREFLEAPWSRTSR